MRVCRWAAGAAAVVLVWGALKCASACMPQNAAPGVPKAWWGLWYEDALLWAAEDDGTEEITWVWPSWEWFTGLLGLSGRKAPETKARESPEKRIIPGRKPAGISLIE